MGGGSSPRSLSRAGIRRTLAAGFPTLFSTTRRSWFGLVAGPSRALRPQDFEWGLLARFSLAFADAGWQTRWRHVCDGCSASLPFSAGSATAFGSALARCHGSDLLPLRLPFAHKPAVCFWNIAGVLEVLRAGPRPASFPEPEVLFVRLSASLVRRVSRGNRQSPPLRAGAQ